MAMGVIRLLPFPRLYTPLLEHSQLRRIKSPWRGQIAYSLLIQSGSLTLYRNRVSNLLTSVLPGPEQSPSELQRFLRPVCL